MCSADVEVDGVGWLRNQTFPEFKSKEKYKNFDDVL
jgi:hypothetical protein